MKWEETLAEWNIFRVWGKLEIKQNRKARGNRCRKSKQRVGATAFPRCCHDFAIFSGVSHTLTTNNI